MMDEMIQAFDEIQMPRTPYVLDKMVVGARFTSEQQYAQCVLEMSIAYDNLRLAKVGVEEKDIEIRRLQDKIQEIKRTRTTPKFSGKEKERQIRETELAIEKKSIEQEQTRRAMLGASREFEYLFNLWAENPNRYTREEMNKAQPEEYRLRLETQAQQDMNATGRIAQGNQEGLRQIGVLPYPQIDIGRQVENRFLEEGKCNLLIVVPTEKKAEKGLPVLDNITIPNGVSYKVLNVFERKVDDAYNYAVQHAIDTKADFILTVEDDTFPPADALVKLFNIIRDNPKSVIGAWYPKREPSREGVHIEKYNGKRRAMPADGTIREAYTICQGCTLFPIEVFLEIPYPWFKWTPNLSPDSFFSQLAREKGYKLLVDTSIRCQHIDRISGEVFE